MHGRLALSEYGDGCANPLAVPEFDEMAGSEPREVYSATDTQEAHFIKAALEEAGIAARVVGDARLLQRGDGCASSWAFSVAWIDMTLHQLSPTLSKELTSALRNDGYNALADLVPLLVITRRCCPDDFCASFYATHATIGDIVAPATRIIVAPVPGLSCIDVMDSTTVYFEILYRPELRALIDQFSAETNNAAH